MSEFFVGLDLGQAQDFTAISVVQQVEVIVDEGPKPFIKKSYGQQASRIIARQYHARHLERVKLGTSYPEVVKRVSVIMGRRELEEPELIVDATGVGAAVVDMLRVAGLFLVPIYITGGDAVGNDGKGGWRVPKRELVGVLQSLLQTGRLKIAQSLKEANTLTRELLNFKVKVNTAGHDSYEALREGDHDDLVLSLALPVWFAEMRAGVDYVGNGGATHIRSARR